MSALHQAVARAIAEVYRGTGGMASGGTYGDLLADRAAASAIRVVFAEAQRATEDVPIETVLPSGQTVWRAANEHQADVQAVLAALGEPA